MLDSHLFFRNAFIETAGGAHNHGLFFCRNRARLLGKTFDSRIVSVGRYQRGERLNQMPCRTIEPRLVAGVNVFAWTASPFFAARDEFAFDDSFRAECHGDVAVQLLLRRRHEDSRTLLQCLKHLGPANDLRKMRRADLLFSLSHQYQIDR